MKGILEFNLPEETEEFETATNGWKYKGALFDVRQQVFRPARKHGYGQVEIQELVEKLDALVAQSDRATTWPCDEYGQPKDATYLIELLEKLFSQVVDESGVTE